MVIAERNFIGAFYTRATLVVETVRSKLQAEIRYVTFRLELARIGDDANFELKLGEVQQMHGQLTTLVSLAIHALTSRVVSLGQYVERVHIERRIALDLYQPRERLGVIRQKPLQRLLSGMN